MSEYFQDPTEEFVLRLCRKSFLSLWSYGNPLRTDGRKELCDILVICEPHVLIFSVKNVALDAQVDQDMASARWWRKAVQDSVSQIYGAERNLARAQWVTRKDGTKGLALPPPKERIVHRISVSLGSKGVLPISSGDFGKGFVHVWDETFLSVIMKELDTVTDLVDYLRSKEDLVARNPGLIIEGGEENLLAIYIHRGRKFPVGEMPPVIGGSLWDQLQEKEPYKLRNEANQESFLWDRRIDYLSRQVLEQKMEFGGTLNDNERVLRHMARESRFARRVLANAFEEFLTGAKAGTLRARMIASPSGVGYVFFAPPADYPRDARVAELGNRCFVARNELTDCQTVVGIGTNVVRAPKGFATDLYLLFVPEWTEKHRRHAEEMKVQLGYFRQPRVTCDEIDEFPNTEHR